MKFEHLKVPDQWNQYFTKYPEGYTLLEALFNWVQQVNDMTDTHNTLNDNVGGFRVELDNFLNQFDGTLQTTIGEKLTEWQDNGILEVVIDSVLQTQITDVQAQITTVQSDITNVETLAGTKADKKTLSSFSALIAALGMAKNSVALQVLGDSTGNDSTEWVYKFSQYLASRYPSFNVNYLLWDDTSQEYLLNAELATAAGGKTRIGGGSQTRYLPNSAIPHITGDMDVRVKLKMSNWKPLSIVTPVARFGASAVERSWYFSILPDGKLQFNFSTDGSNYYSATSPIPNTLANNELAWIRAEVDVNNGGGGYSITFYQSIDGITWTGLQTAYDNAFGTLALNNANGNYEIGGRGQNGETLPAGAELYEVDIRNGINGISVAPRMPDLWLDRLNGFSHPVIGSPTLTIVNGSQSGANLSYLTTKCSKMTPNFGQAVTIVSESHNEWSNIDGAFKTPYIALLDAIAARLPYIPIVLTAQNPQGNLVNGSVPHAIRRKNIFEIARAKNLEVIDAYAAFMPDPSPYLSDGVHTNSAGSDLWKDVVINALP